MITQPNIPTVLVRGGSVIASNAFARSSKQRRTLTD